MTERQMHWPDLVEWSKGGARSFTLRLWMLNEGTFSLRLFYSGGRPEVM